MNRRAVLASTSGALTMLSGCSLLQEASASLALRIFNHTSAPYTVQVAGFRPTGGDTRSDARMFDASIDVPPDGDARRSSVAKTGAYLVRYEAYRDNSELTDEAHVHYYPPDDGVDDVLVFDINQNGRLSRR